MYLPAQIQGPRNNAIFTASVTDRPDDGFQPGPYRPATQGFLPNRLYSEFCCSGQTLTEVSCSLGIAGGSGATVDHFRQFAGTHIAQSASSVHSYIEFDSRYSAEVDGFRAADIRYESELPATGIPFTRYLAFRGSRPANPTYTENQLAWFWSEAEGWRSYNQAVFHSIANNFTASIQPTTEPMFRMASGRACWFRSIHSAVIYAGDFCVDGSVRPFGGIITAEAEIVVSRGMQSPRNSLTYYQSLRYGQAPAFVSLPYFNEQKAVVRSSPQTYVTVRFSIGRNKGCYGFFDASNASFFYEGRVSSDDPCGLSSAPVQLQYLGSQLYLEQTRASNLGPSNTDPARCFGAFWNLCRQEEFATPPSITVSLS